MLPQRSGLLAGQHRDRGLRDGRSPGRGGFSALAASAPWSCVLTITGVFHLYREAYFDGVVFLIVAVVTALDAYLSTATRSSLRIPRLVVVAVAVLAGVLLTLSPRYGQVDQWTIAALGLALIPIAWRGLRPASAPPPRPSPGRRRRSLLVWTTIAIAFCLWELTVYFLGRPSPAAAIAFPPLTDLLDPIIDDTLGRGVFVGMWLIIGVALLWRRR